MCFILILFLILIDFCQRLDLLLMPLFTDSTTCGAKSMTMVPLRHLLLWDWCLLHDLLISHSEWWRKMLGSLRTHYQGRNRLRIRIYKGILATYKVIWAIVTFIIRVMQELLKLRLESLLEYVVLTIIFWQLEFSITTLVNSSITVFIHPY